MGNFCNVIIQYIQLIDYSNNVLNFLYLNYFHTLRIPIVKNCV